MHLCVATSRWFMCKSSTMLVIASNFVFSAEVPRVSDRAMQASSGTSLKLVHPHPDYDVVYAIRSDRAIEVLKLTGYRSIERIDSLPKAAVVFKHQLAEEIESVLDSDIAEMERGRYLVVAIVRLKADNRIMLFRAIGAGETLESRAIAAFPKSEGTYSFLRARWLGGDSIEVLGTRMVATSTSRESFLWMYQNHCTGTSTVIDFAQPFDVGILLETNKLAIESSVSKP